MMRKLMGAAAATMLLAACGSSDEGTISTEDGDLNYEVDRNGGDVTIDMTGPDGEQATVRVGGVDSGDVDLPDGFSLYPGASVDSHMSMNSGRGAGSVVTMTSSDSVDEVIAFYRSQAEAAGLEIKSEISTNDMKLLGGEAEDGTIMSLSAAPNGEDATTIQLTVGRDG